MDSTPSSPPTGDKSQDLLSGVQTAETTPCLPTQETPAPQLCPKQKLRMVYLKLVSKCLRAKYRLRKLCRRDRLKARTPEKVEPKTSGDEAEAKVVVGRKHLRTLIRSRLLWALAKPASAEPEKSSEVFSALPTASPVTTPIELIEEVAKSGAATPAESTRTLHTPPASIPEETCRTVAFPSKHRYNMKLMELCVYLSTWDFAKSDMEWKNMMCQRECDEAAKQMVTRAIAWKPRVQDWVVTANLPKQYSQVYAVRYALPKAKASASKHLETILLHAMVTPTSQLTLLVNASDQTQTSTLTPTLTLTVTLNLTPSLTVTMPLTLPETPTNVVVYPQCPRWLPVNVCTPTKKAWYDYDSDDGFSEFSWFQWPPEKEKLPAAESALDCTAADVVEGDLETRLEPQLSKKSHNKRRGKKKKKSKKKRSKN